ncbi:hypothetical protein [Alteromonas gracilis]|uniref:Spore coat protein n=1 Tax=Alteromonas gracilis TaxID=1479524 RepID=A0ABX5CN99_9ALTE|nr:hypothetical protein [Alteromonas gracilis]PRO68905.1 hypothetical protein C6Y39_10100 [Alteromonas gracilis]
MEDLELIQKLDEMELLTCLLKSYLEGAVVSNNNVQSVIDGLALLQSKIIMKQTNFENSLISQKILSNSGATLTTNN